MSLITSLGLAGGNVLIVPVPPSQSLSQQLTSLTAEYVGRSVTFVCGTGTLTEAVELNDNHSLHFTGDVLNTVATNIPPPLTVGNNARVTQAAGVKFYESNINGKTALIWTRDGASNVIIDGIYFKGHPTNADPNALAGIWLLNAQNSIVRNCTFDNVHNYCAVIGKYPGTPGLSDGCTIEDNTMLGVKTQSIAVTCGTNWKIRRNTLDYTSDTSAGNFFTPIDIEPNHGDEIVDDFEITDNVINMTGSEAYSVAIALQGNILLAGMNRGVVSRNRLITKVDEATYSHCQGMFRVDGCSDLTIDANYGEGTYFPIMGFSNCRDIRLTNSDLYQNLNGISVQGVAESMFTDNVFRFNDTPYPGGGTFGEGELNITASAIGSVITGVQDVAGSYWTFKPFHVGLRILFNATVYTIESVDVAQRPTKATVDGVVGTVTAQTFTSSDVTIGNGNINKTSHGFKTGAMLYPETTGTLPVNAGLVALTPVYAIREDANNFKLATTLANALALTPITYSEAGSGTNTLTPLMATRFSSNTYSGNTAPDGIVLDPDGTSVIV